MKESYMFSLARIVEQAARDYEQLQRVRDEAEQFRRSIESSAHSALNAAQQMASSSLLASVIEMAQKNASILNPAPLAASSLGAPLPSRRDVQVPALGQIAANPLRGIRRVMVVKTLEDANAHLDAGWILISVPAEDNWILGWPYDEEPNEPTDQE